MTFKNLQQFINHLEDIGDLKRITSPVSSILEMTEIHQRVLAKDGPALLFENVITENGKSEIPVLVNLFGSVRRIALALNCKVEDLREIGKTLAFLKQPEPPEGWREAFKMLPLLKTVLTMKPKNVSKAPCQEIVLTGDQVDLRILPIQTCWPNEPAPLITWPLVVTKKYGNDSLNSYNLGIYRMQVVDNKTTIMRWLKHRGGAGHY
ncbi:MAG: UbiD family decarboxylase domain-containing protein, partial [Rickettsiales bacterium]